MFVSYYERNDKINFRRRRSKSPIIPKGETIKIDPQERGVYKAKKGKEVQNAVLSKPEPVGRTQQEAA